MTSTTTSFSRHELDNGVSLFHEQQAEPPVVAIRVFIPGGSSLETPGNEGICHLTGNMLTRQTSQQDMYEFARTVDNNGLKVNAGVNNDYLKLSLSCVSDYRNTLLDVMEEIFTDPAFSAEALERLRRRQLASIRQRRDKAFSYAIDQARGQFYGDHPYNHHKFGLESTVESFVPEDCEQFYRDQIKPRAPIVSVAGDIDRAQLQPLLESLGPFETTDSSIPSPETNHGREYRTKDVDQPTHVLAYPGPEIDHDNYVAAKVLDSLLGGGMSSLLFNEMREERSLGYQVGSTYPSRRLRACFAVYLGGDADTNGETFRTVFDELVRDVVQSGPTEEQLEKAKEYLKGNFLLKHEPPGKRAWYRGFYEVLGRSAEFDTEYAELIAGVTTRNIRNLCEQIFMEREPLFLTVQPND